MRARAASTPRSGRFLQLDALRGIAALTVVADHCMRVIPGSGTGETAHGLAMKIMKFSPLHLIWAGHQAVMFFFVLSGFVLSLPFHTGRTDPYGVFVVRRICRIWIPYIVIVAGALGARLLFADSGSSHVSNWVHDAWGGHLTGFHLLNHASLVGSFNDAQLDPVVWSLTIELRISLIFPLLLWAVRRWRWQLCLVGSFAIGAIGYAMTYYDVAANAGRTISFIPLFVVGILLALYRDQLRAFAAAWIRRFGTVSMLLVAVLAYTYPYWALPHTRVLHLAPPDDWATTVGVVLFIAVALASPQVTAVLHHRLPQWLGRISYSLYLVHAAVLLSFVHLLHGRVPLFVIWGLTLAVSLVLASLGYRFVELPAIKLGKAITRRRTTNRPDSAVPADATAVAAPTSHRSRTT